MNSTITNLTLAIQVSVLAAQTKYLTLEDADKTIFLASYTARLKQAAELLVDINAELNGIIKG